MSHGIGADSEIGCLRTVLVHRPGAELARVTPRTAARLRFDRIPWLARAQQEHDMLADLLRSLGAELLYLTDLLRDVLECPGARDEAIGFVLAGAGLGRDLGSAVRAHLESLHPEDLAAALIAGVTPAELRAGHGLVYELLDPHDFVIAPLPNLTFTRDSSLWIGDQLVITGLRGARARESALLSVVYRFHRRFAGIKPLYDARPDRLDGGDLVLLAPGVVAVGTGSSTAPDGVERLARHLLGSGVARTVLAVPAGRGHRGGHLDLACTVLDPGTILMAPAAAFGLTAVTITSRDGALVASRRQPFLEAASREIGVDRLTLIETGVDPCAGATRGLAGAIRRGGPAAQWDDGANVLAVGGRVIVSDERNALTNARLAAAGFEVVTVPARELSGLGDRHGRGPRSVCAPVQRITALAELDLPRPADPGSILAGAAGPANGPAELANGPAELAGDLAASGQHDAAPVG